MNRHNRLQLNSSHVNGKSQSHVKRKEAEHLYRALHGIQTTLKRSGMDHTAFNMQGTPCLPLPHSVHQMMPSLTEVANI